MVLLCGLKLATEYVGSGASWEGFCCRPRSAAICAWLRVTWWELLSELQLVTSCAGLHLGKAVM